MENNRKIASLGYVSKEEKLGTIEGKVFPYMVLEDKNPFPGYYDRINSPGDRRPAFLFFVMNPAKTARPDEIIRITSKIQKRFKRDFDAQPASISLYNHEHDCIRIDFDEFYIVNDLLKEYVKEGIEFLKAKEVEPYNSFIKVYGFFQLEEIETGIFRNITDQYKYYLEIPETVEWKLFKNMVMTTKNSSDFITFDAALASIYQFCKIADFVRIFADNISLDNLRTLHKRFNYEIERL